MLEICCLEWEIIAPIFQHYIVQITYRASIGEVMISLIFNHQILQNWILLYENEF